MEAAGPAAAEAGAIGSVVAAAGAASMVPFRHASMERIRRALPNVKVQLIADRTHMSIGVHRLNAVAATIREFLLAAPVR